MRSLSVRASAIPTPSATVLPNKFAYVCAGTISTTSASFFITTWIRFFFAGATECEVDKQGRILIPQNLREYAGLEKDIYIIGVSTRVEVWDKDKWENYSGDENVSSEKIAEKMAMLGI